MFHWTLCKILSKVSQKVEVEFDACSVPEKTRKINTHCSKCAKPISKEHHGLATCKGRVKKKQGDKKQRRKILVVQECVLIYRN